MGQHITKLMKRAGIFTDRHPMSPLTVFPSDIAKLVDIVKQDIYDQVKQELIDDAEIEAKESEVERAYLRGINMGVVDSLYHIKMYGTETKE